ncbi:MAG: hypothetical protein WBD63_03995 [Phycisphaerae bacterium]|nr:hypothetical protein [Phycisphaerae bacterium]
MSQSTSFEMRQGLPGEGRLGVMDALSMGWQLLKGDFWNLWLVGLLFYALMVASSGVPFGYVLAGPPLMAGLFYVIARRIDGRPAAVAEIFEGFRQRFGQSIVAMLPLMLAGAASGLVVVPIILMGVLAGAAGGAAADSEEIFGLIFGGTMCLTYAAFLVLIVGVAVFGWFFTFAPLAVWTHPESGWEAAKISMRLVWRNLWSVVGFHLLFWLIGCAGALAGYLTCCVGFLFVVPALVVWYYASVAYLYRSWTGQPLVQPITASEAAAEGGPIPPTSIEPPAGT